jgi:hypothetical protein
LRFRAKVLLKDAKSRMPGITRRGSRGSLRHSGAQLTAVFDAARPLPRASRDAFLLDLATALAGITDIGDGDVARAIRAVQRKHFDPPETDERDEGACFANRQAPISRRETGAPETSR